MPGTVVHALSATTPDNPAFEIKPSNWNSNHQVSLNVAGSEIINAFSNANGFSFGLSNGQVTGSFSTSPGGAGGVAISGGGSSQSSGTIQFLNSNGVTWGLLNGAMTITVQPGAAAGIAAVQVSNTTYTSGTLGFVNANGISFGSSGANGISASFAASNPVNISITGNTAGAPALISSGTMYLSGGANVTINQVGQSLGISVAPPGGGGADTLTGFALGNTTQGSSGTMALSSFNVSAAGLISAGFSNNTLFISAPNTTGISQSMFAGGNTTQGSSGTNNIGVLSLVGAGNVSVGVTNGSYVISATGGGGGGGGVNFGISNLGNTAGSTGTVSTGNVVLVGSGPISLSQSTGAPGSAATITINAPATSSIQGTGQLSVSVNGSTISLGVPVQTMFAVGNTTQNSSGTFTAGVLSINGLGIISVGYSNGSLQLSATGGGGGAAQSIGVSTGGGTAGNTGTFSGQVVFAGGNNITLSVATAAGGAQTITISGANLGGAQTGISGLVVSNTTYTSGTVTLQNANGISFGSSGANGISASYTVPATAGLISALRVSGGAGTSNNLTGLTFANSNGITWGLSTGANVGTMTASVLANLSLFALGNTTQNSSTVLGANVLSLNGIGALTLGFSNGSMQFSAPATSSISATGGLSVSVNGSTISIGQGAISRSIFPEAQFTSIGSPGMGSLSIQYFPCDGALSASRLDALVAWVAGSTASAVTAAIALSAWAIVYTKNVSTLSSLSSGSTQTTYSYASNNAGQTQLLAGGVRAVSVPINMNFSQGEYFVGFNFSTAASSVGAATTNLAQSLSMYGGNQIQSAVNYAEFTAATNTSTNQYGGMGIFTAATAGAPVSIGLSAIAQTGANLAQANIALAFRNI